MHPDPFPPRAAARPNSTLPRVSDVLAGRYRIEGVLGRGGMSTVFAARDVLLDRMVAVKVFAARADTDVELRAQEAEARLVAGLNHYALTTLFDAGVDTADPAHPQIYLVMEFIEGKDLKEQLRSGPLDPAQAAYLAFDLADALAAVHEAGFVHRDVKPANVLLAARNADRRLRGKLTDFGVATIIGFAPKEEFTTGTAAYLSPEVVEGRDATPESDVYSLGLVLIEALTARVSFPGGVTESAFARLERDPVVPPDLPAPLADLLRRMTARRPADRPSAREVELGMQDVVVDDLVSRRRVDPRLFGDGEVERLAALRRYDILDTPADDAFDQITRIAARLLDVPIALVSIIDADRVWHKSRRGTDMEEVDRDVSFCATTNPGTGAWSIPDATLDPRTRNNPVVTDGPRVRAYAAAPLRSHDGHDLGALCVYDTSPRDFDQAALDDLTDLAGIIMRELELRLSSRRAVFNR